MSAATGDENSCLTEFLEGDVNSGSTAVTLQEKKGNSPLVTCEGIINKTILTEGNGWKKPLLESRCQICFQDKSKYNDNVLKDFEVNGTKGLFGEFGLRDCDKLELVIGSSESVLVRLLEKCVMTMKKGEFSQFVLHVSDHLCHISDEARTPGKNLELKIEITLQEFSEVRASWELTFPEKYNLALSHKEKGNEFFKEEKIEAAFCQYSYAVKYLICVPDNADLSDSERREHSQQQCACYLNLGACQLRTGNYSCVIENCTKALNFDPVNVKAHYRRAQALKSCGKVDEARQDLLKARKMQPKNSAVKELLQSLEPAQL